MNQSKTDLGIVNESQLLRFGISGVKTFFQQGDMKVSGMFRRVLTDWSNEMLKLIAGN
jgi:hypothetical protein